MTYSERYDLWCAKATDPAVVEGLKELETAGEKAKEDAFYQDLSFGTAGLRGILGAGTNRMNIYTVGRATQGLADYLNSLPGDAKSVIITRDSRNMGMEFTKLSAAILAANGIKAYYYPRVEPTPACSFAVRYLGCDAGINVTASHNPAAYNGYKVYGPDGCQITSEFAAGIAAAMEAVDPFAGVKIADFDAATAEGTIVCLDEEVIEAFQAAVLEQSLEGAQAADAPLKLVYTPLNGVGLECVGMVLAQVGVTDIAVVPEQAEPDGNFPTCPTPNPEFRSALELGLKLCDVEQPDLLLATDPDADRVGIAVADGDDYTLLTGNEVGALLLDYICRTRIARGEMPENPVAVTTIVSTDMADAVAAKYGVELRRVLTGFKYIGEVIAELESAGHPERFIFGFEESYGYLAGTHVRDKDAIVASMLICQMARYYREQGLNLAEAMRALYGELGYFGNRTLNYGFDGAEGARKMAGIMSGLRENAPAEVAGMAVEAVLDYGQGLGNLPKANVVQFNLAGGHKAIVRPSGTEPKIKVYVFTRGATVEESNKVAEAITAAFNEICA